MNKLDFSANEEAKDILDLDIAIPLQRDRQKTQFILPPSGSTTER
jgi:hypothetical protein